jgi:N-acetylglucosaminyldiphosphoundecaprenol N-acetyl-beta-D-mannosaminyltransferase
MFADRPERLPSYDVLGIRIHALDIDDVISIMRRWIAERSTARAVSFTGMHGVTVGHGDPAFRALLNTFDLVVPDGMPVMLRGRLAGFPLKDRVAGPDLMREFCAQTTHEYNHFFLGGPPGLADRLAAQLAKEYGIRCAGTWVPPFRPMNPDEFETMCEVVNRSNADVLWIGLSTPKQERLTAELRDRLNVPVILAVGAAFDFLAGTKKRAPKWMRGSGLEWLHRLASEPRRLGKRYLVDGSRFIAFNLAELVFRRR